MGAGDKSGLFDLLNNDVVLLILRLARATDTRRVCRRFWRLWREKPQLSKGCRKVLFGDWCLNLTNGTCEYAAALTPTRLAYRNLTVAGVDPAAMYATLLAQDGRFAVWVSNWRVLHVAQLVPEVRLVGFSRLSELTRSVKGLHSLTNYGVALGRKRVVAWSPSGFLAVFALPELRLGAAVSEHVPYLKLVKSGGVQRAGSLNALLHVELVGEEEIVAATCEVDFAMFQLKFFDPKTLAELPVSPAIRKECDGVALAMSFRSRFSDGAPEPEDSGLFAICANGVAMTDSVINPLRWEAHNVVIARFDGRQLVEESRVLSVPDADLALPGTISSGLSDQVLARDTMMLASGAVYDARGGRQVMPRFGLAANVRRNDAVYFVTDSYDLQLVGRILIRRTESKRMRADFASARPKEFASFHFHLHRSSSLVPSNLNDANAGFEFAVYGDVMYVALDHRGDTCEVRAIRLPRAGVPRQKRGKKTLWRQAVPMSRCHDMLRWRVKLMASDEKVCLVVYPRESSLLGNAKVLFLWGDTGALASKVLHLKRDGRTSKSCVLQ